MKKLIIIFLIFTFSFIIAINNLIAQGEGITPDNTNTKTASEPVKLTNPLTGNQKSDDIPVLLGKIINYAMGIIGSLALVMFIYGGAVWMLSRGNQEQVSKGKNIIIWATLGLAIIFTAYALIRFVILAIGGT